MIDYFKFGFWNLFAIWYFVFWFLFVIRGGFLVPVYPG